MKDGPHTERAKRALLRQGYALFERAIDLELLCPLRTDLESLYRKRRAVQKRNGIAQGMSGTCHHLLGENSAMDRLMATLPLHDIIRWFFDGPYILNSFGGFLNDPAREEGYIAAIHRDVRTHSREFKLMLNMLIMLDEFTSENGATYLLPGSQNIADRPNEESFYAQADRARGLAGDIVLFDSRLWHTAGENRSAAPRRALTLTFSRPFMKPQLDYPRYLGATYGASLAPAVRQVLGYEARIPESIDEFYQPPARRAYKADQG